MHTRSIEMINVFDVKYEEYSHWKELSNQALLIINKAKETRNLTYANHSKFKVRAALLLDNNKILTENNQEIGAYPSSSICAERTIIFYTVTNYLCTKIIKMVAVAGKHNPVFIPVSTCKARRQILIKYKCRLKMPIEFLFTGMKGKVIKFSQCANFLPFSFYESTL